MKIIKCNCDNGTVSTLKSVSKCLDNVIIKIFSKEQCPSCNGSGCIAITDTEFNNILSGLDKRIDNLKLELLNLEDSNYAKSIVCSECNGKGDTGSKTLDTGSNSFYIVTSYVCETCKGKGSIVDKEETRKIITNYINVLNQEKFELLDISENTISNSK